MIVGGDVFTGGGGMTFAVGADGAGALEPPALLAVSLTTIVCPMSAAPGTYELPVAPEIGRQLVPSSSHCIHW